MGKETEKDRHKSKAVRKSYLCLRKSFAYNYKHMLID